MAFGLPKPSDIKAMLKEPMDELREELRSIRDLLAEILGELRTQRGAPP